MGTAKILSNIFLLPKKLHSKISAKISTLIVGMFIVGAVDLFIPPQNMLTRIVQSSSGTLILNIIIAFCFVLIIGFLDVLFFAFPIGDFCIFASHKRKEKIPNKIHIIIMKAYILSYLVLVPIELLLKEALQLIEKGLFANFGAIVLIYIIKMYSLLKFFWLSALILRTIATKIKMDVLSKIITFIMVFAWYRITSLAILYLSWNAQKIFEFMQ